MFSWQREKPKPPPVQAPTPPPPIGFWTVVFIVSVLAFAGFIVWNLVLILGGF